MSLSEQAVLIPGDLQEVPGRRLAEAPMSRVPVRMTRMSIGRFLAALPASAIFLLAASCGQRHPSRSMSANPAQIAVTFLKSSLVQQVNQVLLRVVAGDTAVYADTAAVQDGEFAFPAFELPVGEATFLLSAVDSSGRTIYSRNTTVAIVGDSENDISIELLPAIPMVRLSPYFSTVGAGAEFTATLELFNINKFFNGSFRIAYEPERIAFQEAVQQADTAWGPLITFARDLGDTVVLAVSRTQGSPDDIPDGTFSLVRLKFRAIAAGRSALKLGVDRIEDFDGPIAELQALYADYQTVLISPAGSR